MVWEYLVHTITVAGFMSAGRLDAAEMQNALNWYGQQGWELVNAFDTNQPNGGSLYVVLTFKRPKTLVTPPPG